MKTLAGRLSCCLQSLSSYHKMMSGPPVKTARPRPDCQLISLKEFWKPQLLPAGLFCLAYCQIKMDHYLLIYYTVSLHNLSPKCTNLRKDFSIQLTPNTVNNSSPQSDYTPLIFNAACNVSVPFDPQNVQKSSSFWGKFLFPLWAESVSFSSIWWH